MMDELYNAVLKERQRSLNEVQEERAIRLLDKREKEETKI